MYFCCYCSSEEALAQNMSFLTIKACVMWAPKKQRDVGDANRVCERAGSASPLGILWGISDRSSPRVPSPDAPAPVCLFDFSASRAWAPSATSRGPVNWSPTWSWDTVFLKMKGHRKHGRTSCLLLPEGLFKAETMWSYWATPSALGSQRATPSSLGRETGFPSGTRRGLLVQGSEPGDLGLHQPGPWTQPLFPSLLLVSSRHWYNLQAGGFLVKLCALDLLAITGLRDWLSQAASQGVWLALQLRRTQALVS